MRPSPPPPVNDNPKGLQDDLRVYSYKSLNEGLLKASLTHSIERKDWSAVRKILFGWSANLTIFILLLFVFNLYGCQLFEPRETSHTTIVYETEGDQDFVGDNRSREGGTTEALAGSMDEFILSWCISLSQRFLFHEPTVILATKGLPILIGSGFCASLCGEMCGKTILHLINFLFKGVAAIPGILLSYFSYFYYILSGHLEHVCRLAQYVAALLIRVCCCRHKGPRAPRGAAAPEGCPSVRSSVRFSRSFDS